MVQFKSHSSRSFFVKLALPLQQAQTTIMCCCLSKALGRTNQHNPERSAEIEPDGALEEGPGNLMVSLPIAGLETVQCSAKGVHHISKLGWGKKNGIWLYCVGHLGAFFFVIAMPCHFLEAWAYGLYCLLVWQLTLCFLAGMGPL